MSILNVAQCGPLILAHVNVAPTESRWHFTSTAPGLNQVAGGGVLEYSDSTEGWNTDVGWFMQFPSFSGLWLESGSSFPTCWLVL